jgi:hypothetical protein
MVDNADKSWSEARVQGKETRASQPNKSMPSEDVRHHKRIWLGVVLIFTCVALYPIWSVRFLPMQDYPEHLLQIDMLSHRSDPAFDYAKHFDFHLRLAPYVTFYAITLFLSAVLPIEIAGKVSVSLYILAVTLLVMRLARRSGASSAPWGLLLFFPFAFNQQYFQGNINYFYSLPLLVFALLDHEDISRKPLSFWQLCRHLLWQLLLFFTHPLTFVIYILLAGVGAVLSRRKRTECIRGLVPAFMAAVVFLLWFAIENAGGSAGRIWWKPFGSTLAWYGYMFTGMRWFDGVDKVSVVLWIGIGASVIYAFLAGRQATARLPVRYFVFFILTTIGVFTFPFGKGAYSFISVRIAAVSYFFLALLVGRLRFKGALTSLFIALVTAALIHSVVKQRRISAEIQEIEPIVARIPSNSRILPLVFDNNTPELESSFDIHLHDHDYYHLLAGGGLSPYMIENPLFPVHYKTEMNLLAPGEYSPHLFEWESHGSHYEYFVIRAAPSSHISYWPEEIKLIGCSGKWLLFKRVMDGQTVDKKRELDKREGDA